MMLNQYKKFTANESKRYTLQIDTTKQVYNISPSDLFNRIESYFRAVMGAVTKYTGGYPYGKK